MYKTLGTHNYYVYVLTNKNRNVLYIGMTNNLKERLYHHHNPEPFSKAFTTKYKCFYLIYYECFQDVNAAIDRDTVKKMEKRKERNPY